VFEFAGTVEPHPTKRNQTMGKKRKDPLQAALDRPWCYYCIRDFEDETVLHNHQRARHFKCECGKRMNSPRGLLVHAQQVHKTTLTVMENAVAGRESINIDVVGMESIPEAALQDREMAIRAKFYAQDATVKKSIGVDDVDTNDIQEQLRKHREEMEKQKTLEVFVSQSLPYSIPAQYLSFYSNIKFTPSPLALTDTKVFPSGVTFD